MNNVYLKNRLTFLEILSVNFLEYLDSIMNYCYNE